MRCDGSKNPPGFLPGIGPALQAGPFAKIVRQLADNFLTPGPDPNWVHTKAIFLMKDVIIILISNCIA